MSDIDEKQRVSDDVKQEYVDLVELAPQRRGMDALAHDMGSRDAR